MTSAPRQIAAKRYRLLMARGDMTGTVGPQGKARLRTANDVGVTQLQWNQGPHRETGQHRRSAYAYPCRAALRPTYQHFNGIERNDEFCDGKRSALRQVKGSRKTGHNQRHE